MREWYNAHLGVSKDPNGALFEWRDSENTEKKGSTVWSLFPKETKYFLPSQKDFMINFRVENLEELVENLRREGVTIVDNVESYDFGKFVHIMDPEGNKIELWEPVG
jgi:predicted enzyme related to lactoylglutathione lyase